MCDTNSNLEEIYQTVKKKSVTKSNEKSRAEINCENKVIQAILMKNLFC